MPVPTYPLCLTPACVFCVHLHEHIKRNIKKDIEIPKHKHQNVDAAYESQLRNLNPNSVPLTNPRGLDGNPIGRGPSAPSFEMMRDELGVPRDKVEAGAGSRYEMKDAPRKCAFPRGGIPKFVNQKS